MGKNVIETNSIPTVIEKLMNFIHQMKLYSANTNRYQPKKGFFFFNSNLF